MFNYTHSSRGKIKSNFKCFIITFGQHSSINMGLDLDVNNFKIFKMYINYLSACDYIHYNHNTLCYNIQKS